MVALLAGCAAPEPPTLRTGTSQNTRYTPPSPAQPVARPSNPAIVGESAWASEATKWIGAPYRAGGKGRAGMDALNLVQLMYRNVVRIELPKSIEELSRTGFAIPRDQLRPGDIVFFKMRTAGADHAGVFLGNGRFVQAHPSYGVVYSNLSDSIFTSDYLTARRILR